MFRQHYKLAPTDPRYLAMTPDDILLDVWAAHYQANPNDEHVETDVDMESEIFGSSPGEWEDVP